MAKKKAMHKNTQSIVVTVIVLLLSIAVLGGPIILSGINMLSNTVVKINGTKMSKSYFKYYFYNQKMYYEQLGGPDIWSYDMGTNQTTEETAKNGSLNTAVSMILSRQQAEKRGLALTAEELVDLDAKIIEAKTSLGAEGLQIVGASEEELRTIIHDQLLSNKLFEDVTKGFEFSEAAFEEYFQEYFATNHVALTEIQGEVIHTQTRDEADVALASVLSGGDFVEVLKQASVDYDPAAEETHSHISINAGYPQEVVDAAYNTLPGDMTEIIETEGG